MDMMFAELLMDDLWERSLADPPQERPVAAVPVSLPVSPPMAPLVDLRASAPRVPVASW